MEKQSIIGLMAVYMKLSIRMVSNVATEHKSDRMENGTKEIGKAATTWKGTLKLLR